MDNETSQADLEAEIERLRKEASHWLTEYRVVSEGRSWIIKERAALKAARDKMRKERDEALAAQLASAAECERLRKRIEALEESSGFVPYWRAQCRNWQSRTEAASAEVEELTAKLAEAEKMAELYQAHNKEQAIAIRDLRAAREAWHNEAVLRGHVNDELRQRLSTLEAQIDSAALRMKCGSLEESVAKLNDVLRETDENLRIAAQERDAARAQAEELRNDHRAACGEADSWRNVAYKHSLKVEELRAQLAAERETSAALRAELLHLRAVPPSGTHADWQMRVESVRRDIADAQKMVGRAFDTATRKLFEE